MAARTVRMMLDACVLYPTVMREILLGCAAADLFVPRWSDRILEEWARAAARRGDDVIARGEIARLRAAWPAAAVAAQPGLEARLWLPDANDIHVLACAISGSCDGIVTMNAKDFPRNILAEEGISRADPDGFLLGLHAAQPEAVSAVAAAVVTEAERLSGVAWPVRKLMRKAGLPRLGKTLAQV